MIFKRGLNQDDSAPVFVVDCISESRGWSRPGMQGIESSAPLWVRNDSHNQLGIVYERSVTDDSIAVDAMPEHAILGTAGFAGQSAPLFILEEGSMLANFNQDKLMELFSDVEEPNDNTKVYPENIFDYIYGSLHSPSYREKYKEFLKTGFPRIPRPKSWKEFWRVANLGKSLRELHLMHGIIKPTATFPEGGSNIVTKLAYDDSKVWINNSQYFDNVSELAWNFYIGGYQPAQKWLKDRKDRVLTFDDINHYGKIITILNETNHIMKEIG